MRRLKEIIATNKDVTVKKLYLISNLLYKFVTKVPPKPDRIKAKGNLSGPTNFTNKADI